MSKVYVGTYAKYNNGSIAGAWLDLEDYSDSDGFYTACKALHADESDPELMFQDWEDIPAGMISESSIDSEVWEWLELDEDDKELLAVFKDEIDSSGTIEQARDSFQGKHSSPEDWAEQYIDDCGMLESMPANLRCYFDYSTFARDCGFEGASFIQHGGKTWVFSGNY